MDSVNTSRFRLGILSFVVVLVAISGVLGYWTGRDTHGLQQIKITPSTPDGKEIATVLTVYLNGLNKGDLQAYLSQQHTK
jgi:hypothetical protein